MTLFRTVLSASVASGIFAASPAAAIVKIAKFTGVASSGFDATGLFGKVGLDLTGASFVATYVYDKTLGGYQSSGANRDISYGGAGYGTNYASPIISASVSVNGYIVNIPAIYAGQVDRTAHTTYYTTENYLLDGNIETNDYMYNEAFGLDLPVNLDTNLGPVAIANYRFSLQFYSHTYPNGGSSRFAYLTSSEPGTFSVRDAVPEPASWTLMIAGFGIVGIAARRRRRSVSTAA